MAAVGAFLIGESLDLRNLANGAAHLQQLMHERVRARTKCWFPARTAVPLHELRQVF
jgi:hypothetical protein